MFTIRSISDEGTWYLVNGWYKYKKFWQRFDNCVPGTVFKSEASAKRSLTKLLKSMKEIYGNDRFTMVKIQYNEDYFCYDEIELYEMLVVL